MTGRTSALGRHADGPVQVARLCVPICVVLLPTGCSSTSGGNAGDGGSGADAAVDVSLSNDSAADGAPLLDASDATTDASTDAPACAIIGTGGMQVSFGNPQCNACMAASCCNAATACFTLYADGGPSDCGQLSLCIGPCMGDMTCIANCRQMHPQSTTLYDDVGQCLSANCAGGGGPCG